MTQSFERETRYVFSWKKYWKEFYAEKYQESSQIAAGGKVRILQAEFEEGGTKFAKGKIFGDKDAER